MRDQDSEKRAQSKQPQRGSRPPDDEIDDFDEPEDELEPEEQQADLPPNGLRKALIIGAVGGVVSVILNIVLTFINAPAFQTYASQGKNVTYNAALVLVGLQCLNFFVSVLICALAGYIVGRVAVQRRLGFYAGAIAGAIIYLASFLVRYIPNYPGNTSGSSTGSAGGVFIALLLSLVFLCIWGLFGGFAGFIGARIATREHPYYLYRRQ